VKVFDPLGCLLIAQWGLPAAQWHGIAAGPDGDLYVTDGAQVDKFTPAGALVATYTGINGSTGILRGISSDGISLYAVDEAANLVQVFSPAGVGLGPIGPVGFSVPNTSGTQADAVLAGAGRVYVSGFNFSGAEVWSSAGHLLCDESLLGSGVGKSSQLNLGMTLALNGDVLVLDSEQGKVMRFSACGASLPTPSFTVTAAIATPTITVTATATPTPSPTPVATLPALACPVSSGQAPTWAMGQSNLTSTLANMGGSAAADTLDTPWKVRAHGGMVMVADAYNGRVLLYPGPVGSNAPAAAVVVGKASATAPTGGLTGPGTLRFPTGMDSDGSRLVVADYADSRVLIYSPVPSGNGASATMVVGQPSFTASAVNDGTATSALGFNEPYDAILAGTALVVADTGNNRVLVFDPVPTSFNSPATAVIGQAGFTGNAVNQGGGAGANTLNQPYGLFWDGARLYIADSGNNRVLVYNGLPSNSNASAALVLGQPNFASTAAVISAAGMGFPFSVYGDGQRLFVGDGERIQIFSPIPSVSGAAAVGVLGQPDLNSSSNPLFQAVGIGGDGSDLYVADENNNRVLVYSCGGSGSPTPTMTASPSVSVSPSPTWTPTQALTLTSSPTVSATPTPTGTATPYSTPSPTLTASPMTAASTPSPSTTPTPSGSPTPTPVLMACTPVSGPGWPAIGHDAGQSSLSEAVGPAAPTVRWSVTSAGFGRFVTVDGNGGVLTGSNLTRFDAFGNFKWTANTTLTSRNFEAPVLAGANAFILDYQTSIGARGLDSVDLATGAVTSVAVNNGFPVTETGPSPVGSQFYMFGTKNGYPNLLSTSLSGNPIWSLNSVGLSVDGAEDLSGNAYVLDTNGVLTSYAPAGSVRWTQSLASVGELGSVLIEGDYVYVTAFQNTGSQLVEKLDKNGGLQWALPIPALLQLADLHLAAAPDGGVYVGFVTTPQGQGALAKVSSAGSLMWSTVIDASQQDYATNLYPEMIWMVVDAAGTAYVPIDGKIVSVRMDGTLQWTASIPGTWGLALSHDGTLYANGGGTLYAIGGDPCVSAVAPTPAGIHSISSRVEGAKTPMVALLPEGVTAAVGPNPVQGRARLAYRTTAGAKAYVQVMDLGGQQVWRSATIQATGPEATVDLDMGQRASGLYWAVLTQIHPDGTLAHKVIKFAVLH